MRKKKGPYGEAARSCADFSEAGLTLGRSKDNRGAVGPLECEEKSEREKQGGMFRCIRIHTHGQES